MSETNKANGPTRGLATGWSRDQAAPPGASDEAASAEPAFMFTKQELYDAEGILGEAAQLIGGWKNTTPENEWSEWDEDVRRRLAALQIRMYEALTVDSRGSISALEPRSPSTPSESGPQGAADGVEEWEEKRKRLAGNLLNRLKEYVEFLEAHSEKRGSNSEVTRNRERTL